jgi:CubicO group peptidase (beta-lactamase class C family)
VTWLRTCPCALAWAAAFCLAPTRAADSVAEAGPDLLAAVRAFASSAGLDASTPALVARVSRDGAPLLDHAIGLADLAAKRPADAETPFRIASVTKPFTAVAILQLVERGLLRLDDPVDARLPGFPWSGVTVRHLLNHTGGLPDYLGKHGWSRRPDNAEVLRVAGATPLEFLPGTEARYGNTGYVALALLLETVSGQSYEAWLGSQVFAPGGMTRATVPRWDWRTVPDRAVGYQRILGLYVSDDQDRFHGVVGDGGIFAGAAELDRWLDALHGGRLLPEAALEAAFRPAPPHPGAMSYGFGWAVTPVGDDLLVWHNGRWLGFDAFAGRLTGARTNIILLSNAGLRYRSLDLADRLGFPLADRLLAARDAS